MKYSAIIGAIVLSSLCMEAIAQDSQPKYDSMINTIRNAFNAGDPAKIYAFTSAVFRTKMTAEQFASGMNRFRVKSGDWNTHTYKERNDKGYDYLAQFELGNQIFSLKLNDQGKIDRMNFAAVPAIVTNKNYQVPGNNPLSDSLDLRVEQLVRPYIQKANTAGIILAFIDHGRVSRYSYGTVNKDIRELPDADKTIFEIGSITKTFTSLLLAQEVLIGRFRLNDPINRYLPDSVPSLNFQGSPIRLVHLANHTSGLPRLPENIFSGNVDPQNPYQHYVRDSLYSFLQHFKPSAKPGVTFSYSNCGAGLLGVILENQLQVDFGKMVMKRICKPLQMARTFVSIPLDAKPDFAQGYNQDGLATSPWDLAALQGSGAIRSTLNDMIRYTQAQMGRRNSLKKAIELSHTVTFNGPGQVMGLGWRINKVAQQTYFHHSGGTGGFRSYMAFDIDRQIGVVILSNATEDVTPIGEQLIRP